LDTQTGQIVQQFFTKKISSLKFDLHPHFATSGSENVSDVLRELLYLLHQTFFPE
jgi:hypothetical protein